MSRWTAEERCVVQDAETWQEVVSRLPRHTPRAIAVAWHKGHPETKNQRIVTMLLGGRPPQSPAEQDFIRVLWATRRILIREHRQLDAQVFLDILRNGEWQAIGRGGPQ